MLTHYHLSFLLLPSLGSETIARHFWESQESCEGILRAFLAAIAVGSCVSRCWLWAIVIFETFHDHLASIDRSSKRLGLLSRRSHVRFLLQLGIAFRTEKRKFGCSVKFTAGIPTQSCVDARRHRWRWQLDTHHIRINLVLTDFDAGVEMVVSLMRVFGSVNGSWNNGAGQCDRRVDVERRFGIMAVRLRVVVARRRLDGMGKFSILILR